MSQTIINNGDTGLASRSAINSNFTELYKRDASGYGFSPSATAAVNVAAMQAALDVGGIITVNIPGDYEINDTLYIGSNTKLDCSPGVVFKKTGDFSNVIINKGALTRIYNENIDIIGMTISVNGVDNLTDLDVDGLRGQVGLYYVKHLNFYDFRCEDLGVNQYCIQIVKWQDVHFRNVTIEGEKDGIDIGTGHDGLFERFNFTTRDDAIAIYTAGYPSVTLEVGDIYNVVFRDCNDYVKDGVGFTCRMMISSWDDWTNGNTYQTGDICLNSGNAYTSNNANGFSGVASNAPVHSSGSVTGADGITWKYLNASAVYFTTIHDVTFENFTYYDVRTPVDVRFIDDIFMRSVYPGTETLSSIYNVRLLNSTIDGPVNALKNSGNLKSIAISNCVIEGIINVIASEAVYANSNSSLKVTMNGTSIKNMTDYLIDNRKDGQDVYMVASGNIQDSADCKLNTAGTATIRLINTDLQIPHADLADITPTVGDICMTTSGFNVYKSTGWVNLAV